MCTHTHTHIQQLFISVHTYEHIHRSLRKLCNNNHTSLDLFSSEQVSTVTDELVTITSVFLGYVLRSQKHRSHIFTSTSLDLYVNFVS